MLGCTAHPSLVVVVSLPRARRKFYPRFSQGLRLVVARFSVKESYMDWIYCVSFGVGLASILAIGSVLGRWSEEAKRGGAYRRGQGRDE